MRVWFCEIQWPFKFSSCKSSRLAELKEQEDVTAGFPSIPDDVDQVSEQMIVVENGNTDQTLGVLLKSSLKEASNSSSSDKKKGRVQWKDFIGQELVEIKEFTPSESEEEEDYAIAIRNCLCYIQ